MSNHQGESSTAMSLAALNVGAIAPPSPSRPPKLLLKQSADRFALYTLKLFMPYIEIGLDKDIDDQEYHTKLRTLRHLRQVKDWYWENTACWLGHKQHINRCTMSDSFMDVLDWKKSFKRCRLLYRFVVQILFCCEAGNLEKWPEFMVDTRDCYLLQMLIRAVSPLKIRKLHDSCLKFMDPNVLATIFQSSQSLENIHLQINFGCQSLFNLRINCDTVKEITIDLENTYNDSYLRIEQPLFQTFFKSMCKQAVMDCMHEGRNVLITFTELKQIIVRYDILPSELLELIYCLHQYYPNTRTKLICLMALPYDTIQRMHPFVTPTLSFQKDEGVEKVLVYFQHPREICSRQEPLEVYGGVEQCLELSREFSSSINDVQCLIANQQLESLSYIYYNGMTASISSTINDIASALTELNLFGLVADAQQENNLVQTLNKCKNLKALALQVKVQCDPQMGLNDLENLNSLSIRFAKFNPMNLFADVLPGLEPVESHMMKFLYGVIKAATNVKSIEMPVMRNIMQIAELESFQNVHTLNITAGKMEYLRHCLINTPSLKLVVLGRNFGYRKYLGLKKFYKCSDLEIVFSTERLVYPFSKEFEFGF